LQSDFSKLVSPETGLDPGILGLKGTIFSGALKQTK